MATMETVGRRISGARHDAGYGEVPAEELPEEVLFDGREVTVPDGVLNWHYAATSSAAFHAAVRSSTMSTSAALARRYSA